MKEDYKVDPLSIKLTRLKKIQDEMHGIEITWVTIT